MDEKTLRVVTRAALEPLPGLLRDRGFTVVGPTIREAAIVYDEIESLADLPIGWTDEQGPGGYRLRRRSDEALFGYNVGPHSWKGRFHPSDVLLFQAQRNGRDVEFTAPPTESPPVALFGARACDLAAVAIQDRVFLGSASIDPIYATRRRGAFVVAVHCTQAGGTCFCESMRTGPRATRGFDLALTELLGAGEHRFLVENASERGAEIADRLASRPASSEDLAAARAGVERARTSMGRKLDTDGIRDLLYRHAESEVWDAVAHRCLSCTNCTMVCPTCFCTTVEDVSDLSREHAERRRLWDSCFTLGFTHLGSGSVRTSTSSRYRHWITHKLASWHDQFGSSGCVGCGRCITWCPVGIDITEEVGRLREAEGSRAP
ncbi:MAG: sulfite reductase subunit A [Deltaproteobacteria bacterium]|nr:sulfite reductase subunit A [Deltaproteobacteria bacterium]